MVKMDMMFEVVCTKQFIKKKLNYIYDDRVGAVRKMSVRITLPFIYGSRKVNSLPL